MVRGYVLPLTGASLAAHRRDEHAHLMPMATAWYLTSQIHSQMLLYLTSQIPPNVSSGEQTPDAPPCISHNSVELGSGSALLTTRLKS